MIIPGSSRVSVFSNRFESATEPSWGLGQTKRPMVPRNRSRQARSQGRDLLNAARDGYVYRAKGKGQVTLLKRDKDLVLKIRPAYVHSPEMAEVAQIFRLKPGLDKYKIKSELTEEANQEEAW